jgi:catechol 2,3-dioxygenase-like lactoylglutathione lyase family enzyme
MPGHQEDSPSIMATARVRVASLNHVSIPAVDLDASETFYREVFGMTKIAAPNFGFPVRWLRLGDLQLHLQQYGDDPTERSYQHFGIEVCDFERTYAALRGRGAFESDGRYADVWLLPGGEVQLFARDPSANLIEIDCRDATTIDTDIFERDLRVLGDEEPQGPEHLAARLFLTDRAAP